MLVPFTLNGIAVREAFFVSFLGSVGVGANQAFAAGFLFFLVTCSWRCPAPRDHAARGPAQRRVAAGCRAWMTRVASPPSSSRTTRCRGSSSCLDSLAGVETVVVDNGSRDGTVAFVRERYPDVRVVEAENRGLGAGWNIGSARPRARTCCC